MSEKHKINWINAVKALSIIAVFWVHCESYFGYYIGFNRYIGPFYVNAFFFVSGYLFFRKQLSEPVIDEVYSKYINDGAKIQFLNILYRIVIPSVIFATIEFLPKKILRGQTLYLSEFMLETIGGETYWFTSALVISQIILLILLMSRIRSIWIYWVISISILTLGTYVNENKQAEIFITPWFFIQGLYAVPFVTAGGVYWKYENYLKKIFNKWFVFLMLTIYIFVFSFFSEYIGVLVAILDVNFVGYFAGCFASVLLIELCKYSPKNKVLTYIGTNSISFYFMSGALPITMSMVVKCQVSTPNFFGLVVIVGSSLVLASIVTFVLNKYIPWIYDLRRISKRGKYI